MIKVCPPWKLSIEGIISPNGGIGAKCALNVGNVSESWEMVLMLYL
jgi:hypothetical protein